MGYERYDSLTPALSRWERGSSGLFQRPVRAIDESGEDCVYRLNLFVNIDLRKKIEEQLPRAAYLRMESVSFS